MLQHKDQEISFLRAMLGQLNSKVDSLQKTLEGSTRVASVMMALLCTQPHHTVKAPLYMPHSALHHVLVGDYTPEIRPWLTTVRVYKLYLLTY